MKRKKEVNSFPSVSLVAWTVLWPREKDGWKEPPGPVPWVFPLGSMALAAECHSLTGCPPFSKSKAGKVVAGEREQKSRSFQNLSVEEQIYWDYLGFFCP